MPAVLAEHIFNARAAGWKLPDARGLRHAGDREREVAGHGQAAHLQRLLLLLRRTGDRAPGQCGCQDPLQHLSAPNWTSRHSTPLVGCALSQLSSTKTSKSW